jgi:hypothetical protein
MWDNGAGGLEPAMLSPTNAGETATGTTSAASTYSSANAYNAAFAPLFAGFAMEGRDSHQFQRSAAYSTVGNAAIANQDSSTPFIPMAESGVCVAPCAPLGTNCERNTLVCIACFANEATTGIFDPSGKLQKDTAYYGYNNMVATTSPTNTALAIGRVCERALSGQTYLRFKFPYIATGSGGIAARAPKYADTPNADGSYSENTEYQKPVE